MFNTVWAWIISNSFELASIYFFTSGLWLKYFDIGRIYEIKSSSKLQQKKIMNEQASILITKLLSPFGLLLPQTKSRKGSLIELNQKVLENMLNEKNHCVGLLGFVGNDAWIESTSKQRIKCDDDSSSTLIE